MQKLRDNFNIPFLKRELDGKDDKILYDKNSMYYYEKIKVSNFLRNLK